MISPNEKISYCKACAPEIGYKKKWYKTVEPDMQAWFEENRIAYQKIPAHNPDCELIFKGAAPAITSPVNGTEYLINKKDPEPLQLICKTANDVSKVYWYINCKGSGSFLLIKYSVPLTGEIGRASCRERV